MEPDPQAIPQPAPEQLVPEPPKKSHKKPILIIAVVLAVILIAVAVIMIIRANGSEVVETAPAEGTKSSGNTSAGTNRQSTSEKESAVKNVVAELKQVAEEILTVEDEEFGGTKIIQQVQNTYDSGAPYYKPLGAKVGIPLDDSYGLNIEAFNESWESEAYDKYMETYMNPIAAAVENKLTELGFEAYTDVQLIFGQKQYLSEETGVICLPSSSASYNINCSHTSWIAADKVAFINLLADAFEKKEGTLPAIMYATLDRIENSPYAPYQKLTATIDNYAGLFYRSNTDAAWVYFTGTQAMLPCSKYDDDVGARRAFQGEKCYNEKTQEEEIISAA